jgi:hypothetical protein
MDSPTLQTLQDPILLTPCSVFEVAAFQTLARGLLETHRVMQLGVGARQQQPPHQRDVALRRGEMQRRLVSHVVLVRLLVRPHGFSECEASHKRALKGRRLACESTTQGFHSASPPGEVLGSRHANTPCWMCRGPARLCVGMPPAAAMQLLSLSLSLSQGFGRHLKTS